MKNYIHRENLTLLNKRLAEASSESDPNVFSKLSRPCRGQSHEPQGC